MSEIQTFMRAIAVDLGKPPHALSKFSQALEDNWYDTVESLGTVPEEFWKEHGFPGRLVSAIKDKVAGKGPVEEDGWGKQVPKANPGGLRVGGADHRLTEQERQPPRPVRPQPDEEMKEESSKDIYMHEARSILQDFFAEAGTKEQILPSLKTLTTVVQNIANDPMEPKFQTLNATKKAVQEKLLKWASIRRFLTAIGF